MGPGDFNFPEFSAYASPPLASYGDGLGNLQSLPQAAESVYSPTTPQPNGGYNAAGQPLQPLAEKRKGSIGSSSAGAAGGHHNTHQRLMSFDVDDTAQKAAEEDKRRRNTAASARFRIKKKQREQALEKSAKEMTEKVTLLENRISQLETENKWLKNLIMEKNGGSDDVASLWREFNKDRPASGSKTAKESRTAAESSASSTSSKTDSEK